MNHFRVHKKWLTQISKQEANYLQTLAPKLFQDHNKIVWVRLSDYKYPRTALYLPQKYRKLALCEAHNNQFGGHNAALKTYIRISSSYYWPKSILMFSITQNLVYDVNRGKGQLTNHLHFNRCQFRNDLTGEFMQIYSGPC